MKASQLLLVLLFLSVSTFVKPENFILNPNSETKVEITENTYTVLRLHSEISSVSISEKDMDGESFTIISIPGYGKTLKTGYPQLPSYNRLIEIPVGADIEVEITKQSYRDINLDEIGFSNKIFPAQAPVSKNIDDPGTIKPVINKKAYIVNGFAGEQKAKVDILGFMRGVRVGRLEVHPVQYNPVTNTIRVFYNLEIKISFLNPDVSATEMMKQKYFSPYYESIRTKLINYKEVQPDELITGAPVTYVIISDPVFEDALAPFIEWKTRKGFRVITGYTDDPAVGNTTESIKTYLKELYNNPPVGYQPQSFVLLVGDVAQVPAFTGVTGGHFTDFYYSEYTDDMLPECYCGRFSANDPGELEPQISKTLQNETYQLPNSVYLDSVLLIAGTAPGYDTLFGNGQLHYMTNYYLNQNNGIFPHLFLPPFSPDTNFTDLIINKFNNGVSFVNYTGHCSFFGFAEPSFNLGDIQNLSNQDKYPLVIGNCCSSASFGNTCFGEELVRANGKGALSYIGATNLTYWDEDYWWMVGFKDISSNPQYDAENLGLIDRWFHLDGEPYDEWYITQGQLPAAGNLSVTQSASTLAYYYWEVYTLLGDPSLMVNIPDPPYPVVSYSPTISPCMQTFTVNTEPWMYVAISKDGVLHGAAFADENGVADVYIFSPFTEPGTAEVIATGQNWQPFFGTVEIEASQGAYVLLETFVIDDSGGNGDGKVDAGENISLDMTLFNFGAQSSGNLEATLVCADTNITLTNSYNTWQSIDPGASIQKNGAFSFVAGDFFVNGHIADFELTITNGNDTWSSLFQITLHSLITEMPEIEHDEPLYNVNIYPNPVIDEFTIEYSLDVDSKVSVSVIDLSGKEIASENVGFRQSRGTHQLHLKPAGLKPGVYFCKISTGNYSVIRKIVVTD